MDSDSVHQAVTIKVLDLDISERTTATTETGTVSLRINFYARGTKGEQVKIFELTKVKKERAFDVTKGHERRIREVLVEIIEEFSISAWEENLSNPIVDESTENLIIPINLVTGIYFSYNDFVSNIPSKTTDFKIIAKPRTHRKWVGSNSYKLKKTETTWKFKKVWGFSNGEKAFVRHQNEFFEIFAEDGEYKFKGYDIQNVQVINGATLIGGALGGGIAAAAELARMKDNPQIYILNKYSGEVQGQEKQVSVYNGKLINVYFYRKGKNELADLFEFTVNDSLSYSFEPSSMKYFRIRSTESPIKVCYKNSKEVCVDIILHEDKDTFVSISNEEDGIPNIKRVTRSEGEFEGTKAENIQRRRERAKLKERKAEGEKIEGK
ncbi:MAG: hypothetical protein HRT71_13655 [Flavobacteriales bacterium]|nr:hypothetical protein [Flavobacteriales bacterium]